MIRDLRAVLISIYLIIQNSSLSDAKKIARIREELDSIELM